MRLVSFLILAGSVAGCIITAAALGDQNGYVSGWEWATLVWLVPMFVVTIVELMLGPP